MYEEYKIKKYSLTFKGNNKEDVSFTLNPNDIITKTESENGNVIYVVLNNEKVLYVGEAKTSIKTRFSRGFSTYRSFSKGKKPKDGYKGYKWIDLFTKGVNCLDVKVLILNEYSTEKENKHFRESVEGELCWLIRSKKGYWPEHQNEIHFHNDDKAKEIAVNIFEKTFEKKPETL